MPITRRAFAAGAAALPVAQMLPRPSWASLEIGPGMLRSLSDGTLTLPGDFIFGPMPQEELATLLDRLGQPRDQLTPPCNVALWQDGTHTVLFDVGAGPDFMPTAGSLADSLNAIGIAASDVTHVVFTHAHPDHIWGLLDVFDEPVFTNATYMMGGVEWDYWWNPETVNTIGEARAAFAVGARRRMEVIEDRVVRFNDAEEILPGIAAVSTPGHTPGHMSFELRQGGMSAMVLGDAIGNHHIAFARPGWISGADQDMERAAATRRALIERLAAEQMPVLGFHLPGGLGRVEADPAGGYRFIPEVS